MQTLRIACELLPVIHYQIWKTKRNYIHIYTGLRTQLMMRCGMKLWSYDKTYLRPIYQVGLKIAPFYFCDNFVKPHSTVCLKKHLQHF